MSKCPNLEYSSINKCLCRVVNITMYSDYHKVKHFCDSKDRNEKYKLCPVYSKK